MKRIPLGGKVQRTTGARPLLVVDDVIDHRAITGAIVRYVHPDGHVDQNGAIHIVRVYLDDLHGVVVAVAKTGI